jgi:hypothetical protein
VVVVVEEEDVASAQAPRQALGDRADRGQRAPEVLLELARRQAQGTSVTMA